MQHSRVNAVGSESTAHHGMVTSLHPAASEAATAVLRSGGAAHDAVFSALAVLASAEPFMSGLGGHGAALIAAPGKAPVVIDASALGPAAAEATAEVPKRGPAAVPVPRALAGWLAVHAHGGRLGLEELLEPAAAMAEVGTPVAWYTALMVASHARLLQGDPSAAALYLRNHGLPPATASTFRDESDRIANPELANLLRRIPNEGLELLTHGQLGESLVAATGGAGGFLQASDLQALRPIAPSAPLRGRFRGWEVTSGPITSGASSLIAMLHQLEDLNPTTTPLGSAAYYHRMADAQRAAAADRDALGDPDFSNVPIDALISSELAALRKGDLERRGHRRLELPRRDLHRAGYPIIGDEAQPAHSSERSSTTHINVIAPDGTAIAATFTLGYPFGAGIVAAGSGSLLGNTLHQFTLRSGHPNAVAAGKRAVWSGAPTLLRREGATIAVGAPGGERIAGTLAQVLSAHLIYGLSPQRAIEVPRAFAVGGELLIDDRVDPSVALALRDRGWKLTLVREGPFTSNFARPGLIHRYANGGTMGGIDPWRLGTVSGW